MKKVRLIYIVAFLLFMPNISVLAIYNSKWGFGIKGFGNVSVANISDLVFYDNMILEKAKFGSGGTIYGEYNFNSYLGVRSGLLFNYLGWLYNNDKAFGMNLGEINHSFTTGSIRVPLILKFYPAKIHNGLGILFGIEVGIAVIKSISSKLTPQDDWGILGNNKVFNQFSNDIFNTLSLGTSICVEYESPSSGMLFSLGYVFEMRKLFDESGVSKYKLANPNLQSIQLGIGCNLAKSL